MLIFFENKFKLTFIIFSTKPKNTNSMKFSISKAFCYFLIATSTIGDTAGKTARGAGATVEYASWGANQVANAVLSSTEAIGYYTKQAGQGVENGSQWVGQQATNTLRKDEYRDLYFAKPYEFQEKLVENNWVLVDAK